jgi:sec-independent protein translocase protein TatC
MTAVRPIEHEARLSVLEHVGELRVRLMIALAAFTVAFGFAFWQNHAVLSLLNRPLAHASIGASERAGGPLAQTARTEQSLRSALLRQQIAFRALALTEGTPRTTEQALATAASADAAVAVAIPATPQGRQPVTLGIGEPFTQTVIVSAYFALLLALPIILWQLYAFVIPAFSPHERRVATPLLAIAPVLFAAGTAFGYLVVLPGAVSFLQNFNAGSFDALVQARSYYQFVLLTVLATGAFCQIPVAVIGLNSAGILSTRQLRKHRRYAIVALAAIALLLPGTDPVTTALELIPMLVLYELSVLATSLLERRRRHQTHDASR